MSSLNQRITLIDILQDQPDRITLWKKDFSCKIGVDEHGLMNIVIKRIDNSSGPLFGFVILFNMESELGKIVFFFDKNRIDSSEFQLNDPVFSNLAIEFLVRHLILESIVTLHLSPVIQNLLKIEPGLDLGLVVKSHDPLHLFEYTIDTVKPPPAVDMDFEHATLLTPDILES